MSAISSSKTGDTSVAGLEGNPLSRAWQACWKGCGVILAGWLASCGEVTTDLPELADPPRNVLITLIDAWAANHLAAYGYERETMPFFEQIAG